MNTGRPKGSKNKNPKSVEERFWEKVIIRGEDDCWIWTGASNVYGNFWDGDRQILAHRYSYFLHNGHIDNSLEVMHTCDNELCINPRHMVQGTRLENEQDKTRKGRRPSGERMNVPRKLSEEDVRFIRKSVASGIPQRRLSEKLGISPMSISDVVLRKTYAWVE